MIDNHTITFEQGLENIRKEKIEKIKDHDTPMK